MRTPNAHTAARSSKPARTAIWLARVVGILALAVSCVSLAGCGTSSSNAASNADCTTRSVEFGSTGKVEAGKCPTDTAIAIDRTAFGQGTEVGSQVAAAVIGAASATLTNGGQLSIVMYGRDADREATIYKGSLATASQENQFSRSEQSQQIEAAIRATVAAMFAAPSQQPSQLRRALAVLEGEGSDIARSLREAIGAASKDDGNASAVVDLTDGWNSTADFPLPKLIGHESTDELAQHLVALAGTGNNAKVGLIALPTIGQVPPQYQLQQSPELTDRLVKAWKLACKLLHPGKCEVSTSE
jgi:hypothetical protein